MSIELQEMDIPESIFEDGHSRATEFVRFWICDGKDHVALNIGVFEPRDEAHQWGMIAADIAKHAVRGMQQDDPTRGSPEEMLAEIEAAFLRRLHHETRNLTGQIGPKTQ